MNFQKGKISKIQYLEARGSHSRGGCVKIPDRLMFCWHRNSLRGVKIHVWVIPLPLIGNPEMQWIYLHGPTLRWEQTSNYLDPRYFGSAHPCEEARCRGFFTSVISPVFPCACSSSVLWSAVMTSTPGPKSILPPCWRWLCTGNWNITPTLCGRCCWSWWRSTSTARTPNSCCAGEWGGTPYSFAQHGEQAS